ncbi:MAG: DUF4197 domain-containing protein [Rhodovibrionaceae bacterium]
MLRSTIAVVVFSLFLAGQAAADDQTNANRLFIEATQHIETARAASEATAKADAYGTALERLERIVQQYPGSDLAVRLASDGRIGDVSLSMLQANAALARELAERPVADASDEIRRLEQELEELENRAAELRRENQDLTDRLEAARKSAEDSAAQIGDLQSRLTADQEQSVLLASRLEEANKELAALRGGEDAAPIQEAAVPEQPAEQLTAEDLTNAVKDALRVGTERVVDRVGAVDGYNADSAIHVPLPENLRQVDTALTSIGMGSMMDDLELRLNRAAETAAPQARELFFQAIADMTVDDINAVFRGPDDAATQYFRGEMSAPLRERMRPVVEDSLAQAGAVQAYEQAIGQYESIPLLPDVKADLTAHTLDYAMDGLFHYLAIEEAAIRNDAVNRTTELLQRAFADQGG